MQMTKLKYGTQTYHSKVLLRFIKITVDYTEHLILNVRCVFGILILNVRCVFGILFISNFVCEDIDMKTQFTLTSNKTNVI